MRCLGRNLDDHCCWLKGKVCQFLEGNSEPGFRWSCGLRRELGSWDAVLSDTRYKENVAPVLEPLGYTCRDWPDETKGQVCNDCGANVNG